MSKSPKRKGDRGEREICELLGGERSYWQPDKRGDVVDVPYIGCVEVKRRKDGFKQIYQWIQDVDAVAIRADRRDWLVVLPAEDLRQLCRELDALKEVNKSLTLLYKEAFDGSQSQGVRGDGTGELSRDQGRVKGSR